ncbi:hypothetical protein KC19_5G101500 [Ceratodon purpureus]|uniref:Uncharacterized protein n=1 Tax=Ceratodon purpureus TaxID=3225 RepID=A0A8T0I1A8_CERPU|nr:hypothetical protein KC19_5G101500 [Ceratodon purpureus]
MASLWRIFVRGASSPPTISEFLQLSRTNIQRIDSLTSHHESHTEEPLNPYQCRSMSSKLVRTLENIEGRFNLCDEDSSSTFPETSTLPAVAFENLYLISERARELVERCCSVDWCQASTFQILNEDAFKNILLETSLCYNAIYGLLDDKTQYEDLRQTSTFEPPTSAEVMHDRMELLQRYQNLLDKSESSDALIRKQHLATHLLRRLSHMTKRPNIEDCDDCDLSLWPDGKSSGDEWGKNSVFLGSNVYKTTWLDVPCAKKMFDDGVQEEAILAEARILARLNHPNIVKFICWGHDTDTTWCPFIAMEQMERGLHSVIKKQAQFKRGPPFPLLSALDIMLQIAYGTCYLHENGIAHRDLKTSNVVVRQITTLHLQDYLQVKLVDFGLSKVKLSASRSNTISRPKTGTTLYMAPEVFQSGRANWFKADAYSFGIICSVILSGKEPFPSAEFQRSKLYEAICNGRRPMLPSETPRELTRLITECWDTNRNVRPDFVDICTRLAKMRHELLRDQHGLNNETDDSAESYIQDIFKKQSSARNQERSCDQWQLLENVGEEDEWFVPDQEFDIQIQHEVPKTIADYSSKSSSYIEAPERQRYPTPGRVVNDGRSRTSPLKHPIERPYIGMPSLTHSEMQEKPNGQRGRLPQLVPLSSMAPSSRSLTPQRQQPVVDNRTAMAPYSRSLTPHRHQPVVDNRTAMAQAQQQPRAPRALSYTRSLTPQRLPREPSWAPSYARSLTPQRQPALALADQRDRTNSIAQRQQSNSMALDWTEKESNTRNNQGRVSSSMYEDRIPVRLFQDAYPDYTMPWPKAEELDLHNDEDIVYEEEILSWRPRNNVYNVTPVDYGHQHYVIPGQVQPQGPRTSSAHNNYRSSHTTQPGQMRQGSGGFVDTRGRSGISAPESAHVMSYPAHLGMQPGEAEEPTSPGGSSPLWVQPGDLIGLKRLLVQLLNRNGGKMKLSKVPAHYNKLFGRPLYLAEYNAQRLVHLIDKMKDTLVIKGDGTSKTLHLAKKEPGRVTNKYKPSSNVDASKVETVVDLEEEDIKVEEFVGDVHRTNLANFKRQLQELLVVYSYQIPYNDVVKAYQQRYARILDLPSFGVVSMEALFEKVKDVAVIKEKLENGGKRFYLMAV